MVLPENIKQAWHDCPYCKKKIVAYISDKDDLLELVTEEEYKRESK